ncbi:TraR/DksA family transcriptional regulator [Aestuariimicrobium sp. p3-SID1156]|uniref:TraR/DksA family transcriptional regulator n=1 Tax=Aestuariimicrobium sp. p3-SID1156 TaxID=2916038 RepID=UPI00223A93A2|nr:TraR/DksA family transcriptional regulator [Aestuariimicrobium sp. p3-SID1156]MCT1458916.1 TraR/DksA family transcriptional regulator [Aestuariimicrobium sp. p3-SID1156]
MTAKAAEDAAVQLPVREGEDPWTDEEVVEVREELTSEIERMTRAIAAAEAELAELLSEGSVGAGRDPADVGSSNFERDQEMSLASNSREMLEQNQHALRLLEQGKYGYCENCGQPIGKARLQAFPRATMCVACKQRSERR